MRKIFTLLTFVLGLVTITQAQEPQYSQFYAAPLYLNPAFTGNTEGTRFAAIYRNQWPAVSGTFQSVSASLDLNLEQVNSGIGFYVHRDQAGSAGLSYTNVGVAYSYTVRFTPKLAFKPSLGIAFSQRGVDPTKLVFGDQLISGANSSIQTSAVYDNTYYMDLCTGGLFYGDQFWVGYSAYHINRPNESLMDDEERSSVRHSLHGGYNYPLRTTGKGVIESSLTFSGNLKVQREWTQLDLGGYFQYSPFLMGVWYRGIPVSKTINQNANNDAIVVLAGIKLDKFKFAYSYDITVSKIWANTGGSHEVSLIYETANKKKRKRRFRRVPCPSF